MKPCAFEYVRPRDLDEVLLALSNPDGRDLKLLAGGQSLVPMMNFRAVSPQILVDINRVKDLDYVVADSATLRVGALARHSDLKASTIVREAFPLMTEAYEHVAHHAVRNRGTIGGNLAHADPASEMPAVMVAADATFLVKSRERERFLDASAFFVGPLQTLLEPNELLVEIRIPIKKHVGWAFEEMSSRNGDFALAAVAVLLEMKGGLCHSVAIALCGVGERAIRLIEPERRLIGTPISERDINEAVAELSTRIDFVESPGVSAGFRRQVAGVLTARSLERARRRAGDAA